MESNKKKFCIECGEELTCEKLNGWDLYKCNNENCKFYNSWVPISYEKQDVDGKPAIGVQPYYVFYPRRIRELSEAISRHADKPYDHCVYDWLREIDILRRMYRGMESVMKQKEFYEEELKVDKK